VLRWWDLRINPKDQSQGLIQYTSPCTLGSGGPGPPFPFLDYSLALMLPPMSTTETAPELAMASMIGRRVSCRAYQSTPVPKSHLLKILEAARLAPSACNMQPWRFAVVRNPDLRRCIVEEGFLPGITMSWAVDAPVQVIIGMERSLLTHRLAASVSGVDYPWVDIGIAGEHLVLAATELGLGTCWIGWIRPRVVAKLVGWSRAVKPVVVITVGYPTEAAPVVLPALRRKPLAELVKWL
jgi:nitroreductase